MEANGGRCGRFFSDCATGYGGTGNHRSRARSYTLRHSGRQKPSGNRSLQRASFDQGPSRRRTAVAADELTSYLIRAVIPSCEGCSGSADEGHGRPGAVLHGGLLGVRFGSQAPVSGLRELPLRLPGALRSSKFPVWGARRTYVELEGQRLLSTASLTGLPKVPWLQPPFNRPPNKKFSAIYP